MNDEQWILLQAYLADWLNKASVGCWLIGLFQPDHMFGGFIGAVIFGVTGLIFRIWGKK